MVYKAGDNTVEHDGIEHAGFLSFMGMLALFPFLVFFFAILGTLGETKKGTELIHWMLETADPNITQAILPSIEEVLSGPPQTLLTISILGALWTSSSMVEGLRGVLNKAYRVHTPPNYWLRRLFSISQIMALSVILLMAMFALVVAPALFEEVYGFVISFNAAAEFIGNDTQIEFGADNFIFLGVEWRYYRYAGVILTMLAFVSALYYFLPNVKHSWRRTLPGALIAACGWFGMGKLFSYYLGNFDSFSLIYGSLGSIIAFLVFFYVLSIIFIYGAEFNYLLEKARGETIKEREKVKPQDVRKTEKYLDIEQENANKKVKSKTKAKKRLSAQQSKKEKKKNGKTKK